MGDHHQLGFAAVLTLLLLVLVLAIVKILQLGWILVWRPYVLTKFFKKQGIKGPSYSFLHGSLKEFTKIKSDARNITLDLNSNDIIPKVLPHYHIWQAEVAKQVVGNKSGFWERSKMKPALIALAGKGLGVIGGTIWVRHRKILNPAFSTEKLKLVTKRMAACTIDMIDE